MVSSYVMPFSKDGSIVNNNNPLTIKISASTDASKVEVWSSYSRHKETWTSYTKLGEGSKLSDNYWYYSFSAPSGAAYYRFYSRASSNNDYEGVPSSGYDEEYAVYYNFTGTIQKGFNFIALPVKNNWDGIADMASYFNNIAYDTYDERQIQAIYTLPHPTKRGIYNQEFWNVHPVDAIPDSNDNFNNYKADSLKCYKIYSDNTFEWSYSGALLEHASISTMLYSGSWTAITMPHYPSASASGCFCKSANVLKVREYNTNTNTWEPAYFCGSPLSSPWYDFGDVLFVFKTTSQSNEWWNGYI